MSMHSLALDSSLGEVSPQMKICCVLCYDVVLLKKIVSSGGELKNT